MSNKVGSSSQTHDSLTESIDLKNSRKLAVYHQEAQLTYSEVAQITLATKAILKQVERLCSLLAKNIELNTPLQTVKLPASVEMRRRQAHPAPTYAVACLSNVMRRTTKQHADNAQNVCISPLGSSTKGTIFNDLYVYLRPC